MWIVEWYKGAAWDMEYSNDPKEAYEIAMMKRTEGMQRVAIRIIATLKEVQEIQEGSN